MLCARPRRTTARCPRRGRRRWRAAAPCSELGLMFIFEVQNVMVSRPRLAAPFSPWGGRDCGSRGEGMGCGVPRNEPIAERMCVVRPSGRVPLCSRTKYQRAVVSIQITPQPRPSLSRAARPRQLQRLLADGEQVPVDHHQALDGGEGVLLHLGVRVLEDRHHLWREARGVRRGVT